MGFLSSYLDRLPWGEMFLRILSIGLKLLMRLAEYLGWSGVLVLGLEDLIGVGEYVGLPRGGL